MGDRTTGTLTSFENALSDTDSASSGEPTTLRYDGTYLDNGAEHESTSGRRSSYGGFSLSALKAAIQPELELETSVEEHDEHNTATVRISFSNVELGYEGEETKSIILAKLRAHAIQLTYISLLTQALHPSSQAIFQANFPGDFEIYFNEEHTRLLYNPAGDIIGFRLLDSETPETDYIDIQLDIDSHGQPQAFSDSVCSRIDFQVHGEKHRDILNHLTAGRVNLRQDSLSWEAFASKVCARVGESVTSAAYYLQESTTKQINPVSLTIDYFYYKLFCRPLQHGPRLALMSPDSKQRDSFDSNAPTEGSEEETIKKGPLFDAARHATRCIQHQISTKSADTIGRQLDKYLSALDKEHNTWQARSQHGFFSWSKTLRHYAADKAEQKRLKQQAAETLKERMNAHGATFSSAFKGLDIVSRDSLQASTFKSGLFAGRGNKIIAAGCQQETKPIRQ